MGNRRLANGFQWCYQKDLKDKVNKPPREIKTQAVQIVQYTMGGKKLKIWNSITEATNETGILDSHISNCCKGKRQSAGQYQWRYAEDEIEELPPLYNKRPVRCIETGEIFPTPNHAAKHFKYTQQTVKGSCMGKKTIKPFHFEWWDEV